MIKLLLFLVICNQILSDTKFIISVPEKIRPNSAVGDLFPLIVKPTVDVTEETEMQCNGNIRYRTPDNHNPDLNDVNPKTNILPFSAEDDTLPLIYFVHASDSALEIIQLET